jgi:hypothetical protein
MAVFLITSEKENSELGKVIAQKFPDSHLKVSGSVWFVVAEKLTRELAEELGILGGGQGRAIVVMVENWSGWQNKSIWEWLKLKARS